MIWNNFINIFDTFKNNESIGKILVCLILCTIFELVYKFDELLRFTSKKISSDLLANKLCGKQNLFMSN